MSMIKRKILIIITIVLNKLQITIENLINKIDNYLK